MTQPVFLDARRDLLGGFIDYAGLFPPASLDLPAAVAEYRAARAGHAAWMLGTFVITASRLQDLAGELVASMRPDEEPWRISVILDGNAATAAADAAAFDAHMSPAATVAGAEVRLPDAVGHASTPEASAEAARASATAAGSISSSISPYLEVPLGAGVPGITVAVAGLSALRDAMARPLGAKIRCGGEHRSMFPEPELVARFMVECRDAALPFKATAGLHHPVRHHFAELDVKRHGFLNLAVAATLAEAGADEATITAVIAEEDPAALKVGAAGVGWSESRAGAATIKATRAGLFRSYGSCSFDEPVDDLEQLGLLGRVSP